jgi:AcrR family transcriptional regulator
MIVAAAREMLVEHGLAGTSAREIADAAEISMGTLTYHFASVDEILRAVLEREVETFWEGGWKRVLEQPTPRERLRWYVLEHFAADARDQFVIYIDFWARSLHVPALTEWQARRYAKVRRRLVRLLRQASPQLPLAAARRLAAEFMAVLDGVVVQLLLGDPRFDERKARRLLLDYVDARLLPPLDERSAS